MGFHRASIPLGSLFLASLLGACVIGGNTTHGSRGTSGPSGSTGTTIGGQGGFGGAGFGGAGGGFGGGANGGAGGAGPFAPGPHGAMPQVVDFGGTVLAAPKVQLISWASDPNAPDMDAAVQELATGASAVAWTEQTAEYSVGPLTVLPTISLTGTPPASFDDNAPANGSSPFQQYLANQISGASPAWGPADPSTIYMFILPAGTNISASGKCCSSFLGYHDEAPVAGGSVPYAIVCTCPGGAGLSTLDNLTTTLNHELAEAATDPFPFSNSAFAETDDAHFIWTPALGGEVADMCDDNSDTNILPAGATYKIQRTWSNAAAQAGTNPCVPAPSDPYFNSIPVLSDNITIDYYGQAVSTKGVKIPVGGTRTIDVQLFSEAKAAGPWTVTAYDYNDYTGYGAKNVDVKLDKTSGQNGDVLHLTITVNSYDGSLNGAGFVLDSYLGSSGQDNLFFAAIGN